MLKLLPFLTKALPLLKKLFGWFMTPIPFALGPLLILCFLSFRSCQLNRKYEKSTVQISDTLAMALADVRRLREDTAALKKRERAFLILINQQDKAYENYSRYLDSLNNDDLQREVDRVFNNR